MRILYQFLGLVNLYECSILEIRRFIYLWAPNDKLLAPRTKQSGGEADTPLNQFVAGSKRLLEG
jgi:hypothetical protein